MTSICFVLVMIMVVGLLACGKEETQDETPKGFSVGFGRADVVIRPYKLQYTAMRGIIRETEIATAALQPRNDNKE